MAQISSIAFKVRIINQIIRKENRLGLIMAAICQVSFLYFIKIYI